MAEPGHCFASVLGLDVKVKGRCRDARMPHEILNRFNVHTAYNRATPIRVPQNVGRENWKHLNSVTCCIDDRNDNGPGRTRTYDQRIMSPPL